MAFQIITDNITLTGSHPSPQLFKWWMPKGWYVLNVSYAAEDEDAVADIFLVGGGPSSDDWTGLDIAVLTLKYSGDTDEVVNVNILVTDEGHAPYVTYAGIAASEGLG